jgi:hypothetical protein
MSLLAPDVRKGATVGCRIGGNDLVIEPLHLNAARDKAVTAAKRKQLQKETDQIPGHVAKIRR